MYVPQYLSLTVPRLCMQGCVFFEHLMSATQRKCLPQKDFEHWPCMKSDSEYYSPPCHQEKFPVPLLSVKILILIKVNMISSPTRNITEECARSVPAGDQ